QAGGDSVGRANLGDYLERIIDLDGLVAAIHHTSCIAHGGARGPSSAPAVTRKEARRRLTNGRTPAPSLPSAPKGRTGNGLLIWPAAFDKTSVSAVATPSLVSFRFQDSFGLPSAAGINAWQPPLSFCPSCRLACRSITERSFFPKRSTAS